jgi:AraC-like DNA-binding protein
MLYLLFARGVGSLFFAVVQLTAANKQPLHYCMAVGCLAAGGIFIYLSGAAGRLILRLPWLANSDIALLLVVSPAFYLTSVTILHEGRRPVRSYLIYFAVPAALAFGTELYDALTAERLKDGAVLGHFSSVALRSFTLAADLLFIAAIVLALLTALRLSWARQVGDRAAFRHQVVFLFFYLASATVIMVGWVLRNEHLYAVGCLITGLVVVCYALSRTAPFYFAQNRRLLRLGRKKPPWDASAPELTIRLSRLMEHEAPYRDERLTLQRLAGMLGEEPKRLSYHLNVNLSNTFRGYINELRLIAVCRDLLGDPHRAILDVAFSNGFNSKSSFNALFVRKYGLTPKEYRQKHLEHPGGTTRLSLEKQRS